MSPARLRPRHVPCRQRLLSAGRAHRHQADEDQHRVEHGLPRFRRSAGHDGRRADDGRDRLEARPRSARRAQAQFLRTGPRHHALRHDGRGQHRAGNRRALRDGERLSRAAQGDRGVQCRSAIAQARPRADAGEVRHLVHANASQPGRRAGASLSGRLDPPEPRRHRDGAGALHQGGAGGRRGVRRRPRPREDHRDDDREGAEHVADRRVVGHRPQRHGGEGRRRHDQGAADRCSRRDSRNVPIDQIEFRDNRVFIGNESVAFAGLRCARPISRASRSRRPAYYRTPKIHWDRSRAKAGRSIYFAYGAACSEVLRRHHDWRDEGRRASTSSTTSASRSIRRSTSARSRAASSRAWAGSPPRSSSSTKDGRFATHAPSTYKIPCSSDVPEHFRVTLWDGTNREETIYRSKAVGEPPLMLAISVFAAIADAIHSLKPGDSCRSTRPATPEAIMRAVRAVAQH